MRITAYSTTSGALVKISDRLLAKKDITRQMEPAITKFMPTHHFIIWRQRCIFLAPKFCPTKVVAAWEKADKIKNAAYIAENTKWLEDNKMKEGVVTLPSGLQYKVITAGKGKVATKSDNVTVKYEGKMIDGTVFDSSYKRNPDTTTFRPDQVIKGWTEALCLMPEGSKWELYIPQELAYGERQAGKIKPYSTLIFTVEVVSVETQADKAAKAASKK